MILEAHVVRVDGTYRPRLRRIFSASFVLAAGLRWPAVVRDEAQVLESLMLKWFSAAAERACLRSAVRRLTVSGTTTAPPNSIPLNVIREWSGLTFAWWLER